MAEIHEKCTVTSIYQSKKTNELYVTFATLGNSFQAKLDKTVSGLIQGLEINAVFDAMPKQFVTNFNNQPMVNMSFIPKTLKSYTPLKK